LCLLIVSDCSRSGAIDSLRRLLSLATCARIVTDPCPVVPFGAGLPTAPDGKRESAAQARPLLALRTRVRAVISCLWFRQPPRPLSTLASSCPRFGQRPMATFRGQ